jgi:ABC-type uncharacterized transport system fused permease/ATPase subunit
MHLCCFVNGIGVGYKELFLVMMPYSPLARSNVDVMTPAGKLLAGQLSLAVQPGCSLLVTGPNGSGKTSVFRWVQHV